MTKRVYIETYGCQMNDYESDRTRRLFEDHHQYVSVTTPEEADVVLFNTCSIRDKADHKAMSSVGRLRDLKAERPNLIIGVGGCMAQMQGDEIQRRAPHVDLVFGTHQWNRLPELLNEISEQREQRIEIEMYGWKKYTFLPYRESKQAHPVCELVTVQNGCNKFCTFCLVPFTRGREVSRPMADVVGEVESLVRKGVREVMLLGQNVNAYGQDQTGTTRFPELLRAVAAVDGLWRIRFMTSHPAELTPEMVETMASEEKICPHLHLPLQSGSDSVLARMERGHTLADYRKKVELLRSRIPEVGLTTDLIVGFPGETEDEFSRSLDALQEFNFDDSYSFCFSPRPNTKAAKWVAEYVDGAVALERLERLQALQAEISMRRNLKFFGRTVEVLVEGEAKKGGGLLFGRTGDCRAVNFPGPIDWIGTLAPVEIREVLAHSFRGERHVG